MDEHFGEGHFMEHLRVANRNQWTDGMKHDI